MPSTNGTENVLILLGQCNAAGEIRSLLRDKFKLSSLPGSHPVASPCVLITEPLSQHDSVDPSFPHTTIAVTNTVDDGIRAVRDGAFDFINLPVDEAQLNIVVERAAAYARLCESDRSNNGLLERLNFLANNDPLTGLSNRFFFEYELYRRLTRGFERGRSAVICLTLDRFKGLRDALGHTPGARLLVEVAQRLRCLDGRGVTIARLEGDEFGLLLDGYGHEEAAAYATDLLEAFSLPFTVGEYEMTISASVGIAVYPHDGNDGPTLLKNAGAALSYARKDGGNNYRFYTSEIHKTALRRLALENEMRQALVRNEFELYYQPKIEVSTGKVAGMEALVRWNHPYLGLMYPADFIGLAEATGLIVPLGEWILREACWQTRVWHDEGIMLNVAVNISPWQFQQKDMVDKIISIIAETDLDPSYLELEITETSIMHKTESAVGRLHELRRAGIKITIDDFGTGHSSIGYLKHLPIDVLKIDKSFIDNVTVDQDDAALVMAIVTMAHTLRMTVVAEGVESAEQLRFLGLLQCDQWQGHHFSPALPANDFAALARLHQ